MHLARALENLNRCLKEQDDSVFLMSWSTAVKDLRPIATGFDSKIIDYIQSSKLRKWLSPKYSKPRLLYRGTKDGFQVSNFHRLCDNKGPTLSIILTTKGNIFGGFTSVAWESVGGYVEDPDAWIFTLKCSTNVGPAKLLGNGDGDQIYDHASYGPTFGAGHDIYVSDLANSNTNSYTSIGNSYICPNPSLEYLDGSQQYQARELEVFGF